MPLQHSFYTSVIMVEPSHYAIDYAINPYMLSPSGELNTVDKSLAHQQWSQLREKFIELGLNVHVLAGVPGLPDMVFAANQSFVFIDPVSGDPTALMGRMHSSQRKAEVKFFEQWYRQRGFKVVHLNLDQASFEGTGDALLHPGGAAVWGGYGHRTHPEVYAEMAERWGLKIKTLRLVNPTFYHLDTCFAILDEDTVVIQRHAFDQEGINEIQKSFGHIIEVELRENQQFLAANCFCPNGKDVIVQKGADKFSARLARLGFKLHEVETGEFIKAGGSVFCLKMALPSGVQV